MTFLLTWKGAFNVPLQNKLSEQSTWNTVIYIIFLFIFIFCSGKDLKAYRALKVWILTRHNSVEFQCILYQSVLIFPSEYIDLKLFLIYTFILKALNTAFSYKHRVPTWWRSFVSLRSFGYCTWAISLFVFLLGGAQLERSDVLTSTGFFQFIHLFVILCKKWKQEDQLLVLKLLISHKCVGVRSSAADFSSKCSQI